MAAVLIIIGVATTGIAWTIVRSALPGATRRGQQRRRGVAFLAAGMLLGGVSTVAAGLAHWLAPDAHLMEVPLPAELPLIGLFLTVGSYLLGLLLMPAAAATFVGRLRRMMDGLGIGVLSFVIVWLLLFSHLDMRGGALTAVLLASVAVSTATVGSVRAMQFHPAALACGAGGVLSMAGLTGLVVALDYYAPAAWPLTAAALILAGAALTWYGLLLTKGTPAPGTPVPGTPADGDGSFAGYPMLALPVAGALVAGSYHLVVYHGFDTTSIWLGISAMTIVALRETLAVIDIRRYARRLAAREEHFRSLVVGSTDVTMVLDAQLVVSWQAPSAARHFGLSDQDVVGRPLMALVHPDDTGSVADCLGAVLAEEAGTAHARLVDARLRDGFGAWRETEWSVSDQRAVPAVQALVVHVRDISERKELERTLHRTAFVDQLTGLPNRRELRLAMAARTGPGTLIVLGLGGVTGVNQVHGHETGDAVLAEAARRLRVGVAATDVPARLDGDQFAVFTDGGAVQAQLLAARLLTMLAQPYAVSGVSAHLAASAGLAEFPPGSDSDEALRRAELALRRACRRVDGDAAQWYDEDMEAVLRRRLSIEQEMPGVAGRGELDVLFQPIVELPGRRPVGMETLLCWRHPRLGTVDAAEFLPAADELGLRDEIGDWLLQRTCRQLAAWERLGWNIWLSIDVSATQLAQPAYVGALTAALEAHLLPPSRLVLEVAEAGLGNRSSDADRAAAARAHTVAFHLAELRSMGVRTALDHFGSHATALSQLRMLPLDTIKLDRHLLRDPTGRAGPAVAIMDAVVNLAQQLGVEVVVQGLESEADLEAAVAAGCRYGQGDLLCRPAPLEHVEAYLEYHRKCSL